MPSCWVRSSKRLKKKSSRGSIIDWHRKCIRPGALRKHSTDISPEKGSQAGVVLRSPPTDRQLSDSLTFVERPQAQPLPLPGSQFTDICNCGDSAPIEASLNKCSKSTVLLPLPKPGHVKIGKPAVDCDDYLANASNFCDGYVDTDDPLDPGPLGPVPCNYENEIKSATSSPPGVKQMDQCLFANKKNSTEILSPAKIPLHNQTAIASPKQDSINSHDTRLQIRRKSGLLSAPDSSTSSPSRSPIKVFGQEPLMNSSFWLGKPYAESLLGSGQCSSPGSGHDSIAGDMSCQLIWPQSRCSPECSPLPSPRMTSPGPNSRIHSGAVTPLHPRSRESSTLMSTARPDDGKQKSHRLPLPPLKISNPSPFSPSSARTSPGTQLRSPSSPASRWKKGRLLGSGTFGQVYIGFNSETGEMCAMKEVTLFSDDAKSKESAQQLGQEIALLSRFCHPNIVRYYGSGTLDDKLYIYLEYVSGGSIHKILQEYGQLGEAAIRSYTQQILSGLAYLHTKNTLHRDIKGANILIDPSGRVKLADFGMAKHITGPSCPLSFKGSPYWMAPEVIRNSSSCNLAVDIWSLGCTVLEMATAKPPWSQYEGVAAMFKIGNSKELPEIPAHLSDEGNDFIMRCLQRNPSKRPTAAQLLEHPFVKSSASLERHVQSARSFRHSDTPLCLESPGAVIRCRIPKAAYGFSDSYTMKNVSCPVSPVRSPLSHSRSSQHMSGRLSPSPMSSPRVTSGSSTPSGHGSGTLPFHHQKQPTNYLHEGVEMIAGSQNSVFQHSNDYRDQKSNIFRGIVQAHLSPEPVSHKSDVHRNKVERPISRDQQKEQSYNPHLALADRVSQQLLRNPLRLDPVMELSSNP